MCYWGLLGLERSLAGTYTAADIKKAYHTMSRQHHPDKNPDNPAITELYQQIGNANMVLATNLSKK